MERISRYINTDLDIVSSEDLEHLVPIFEEKCFVLNSVKLNDGQCQSKWFFTVEAAGSGMTGDKTHNPVRDISELLRVIENFDSDTKRKLKKAEKFVFDIGWDSGDQSRQFSLPAELLERISALGAAIAVTIYPPSDE